jgi:transposase
MNQADYANVHFLAAVCPETGQAEGMLCDKLNCHVMGDFLNQISRKLSPDRHAVFILDRASYHRAKSLVVPFNITLIHLPPYSPELNPIENLWHYMRSHYWSNRIYIDKQALCEAAKTSWESVRLQPENIKTICAVHYVW